MKRDTKGRLSKVADKAATAIVPFLILVLTRDYSVEFCRLAQYLQRRMTIFFHVWLDHLQIRNTAIELITLLPTSFVTTLTIVLILLSWRIATGIYALIITAAINPSILS